jgi:hypothetical protein
MYKHEARKNINKKIRIKSDRKKKEDEIMKKINCRNYIK